MSIKSLPVFLKKVFEEKGKTNPFQDFKDSQQKDIELTRFLPYKSLTKPMIKEPISSYGMVFYIGVTKEKMVRLISN